MTSPYAEQCSSGHNLRLQQSLHHSADAARAGKSLTGNGTKHPACQQQRTRIRSVSVCRLWMVRSLWRIFSAVFCCFSVRAWLCEKMRQSTAAGQKRSAGRFSSHKYVQGAVQSAGFVSQLQMSSAGPPLASSFRLHPVGPSIAMCHSTAAGQGHLPADCLTS